MVRVVTKISQHIILGRGGLGRTQEILIKGSANVLSKILQNLKFSGFVKILQNLKFSQSKQHYYFHINLTCRSKYLYIIIIDMQHRYCII